MSISVNCPTCGKAYNLNESLVGKKVRCKHCADTFPVELDAVLPANPPPIPTQGGMLLQDEAGSKPPPVVELASPDDYPEVVKVAPREEKKKPDKKGFPVVLFVLGGLALFVLLLCGGIGTGVFFIIMKVRNTANEIANDFNNNVSPPRPQTIADALADLQSGNDRRKQQGAEWLETRPVDQGQRTKVANALEPLLIDVNSNVKTHAANAMVNWAGKENVPALIRCVEAEDPSTTEAAIKALVRIGDQRAIAPIAKLLPNGGRRALAVSALQSFSLICKLEVVEPEVVKYAFHQDQGTRDEVQRLLGSWKTKDSVLVVQAIAELKSNEPNRRMSAALWLSQKPAIAKYRDDVSVALNPVLKDANEQARNNAIKAMQEWATKANVPTLIDLLNDQNLQHSRELRGIVFATLTSLKDERAAAVFAKDLATRDWRAQAQAGLEAIGAAAESEVVKYFNHPDADTRKRAAEILMKIGTKPEVLVALSVADLKSTDATQRANAALWLSQTAVIEKQRDEVSAALNAVLKDKNDTARNNAIQAVRRWSTKANVPTLVEMLNDPVWNRARELRGILFATLADLKDERAAAVFCQDLNNKEWSTKAVAALEAIGPGAEPAVLQVLHHPDANTRKRAAELLKKYDTKDEKLFAQALADLKNKEAAGSREGAALTLAGLPLNEEKRAEASAALDLVFQDKERVVQVAALKAAKIWGTKDNVPTLLKLGTEQINRPKEVSSGALELLVELKDERAYWPIAQLCSNAFKHEDGKKYLALIGAAAEPEVVKHLTDENAKEREKAWIALNVIGLKKNLAAYEAIAKNEKDFGAKRAAEAALKVISARE